MTESRGEREVAERIARGAFVLLDKPRGPSSHQVTAWARDLLGVPLAGHAGTLDPNVSGVLWVGVGPALKLVPLVLEFPKRYVGVVTFHGPVDSRRLSEILGEFTAPIFQTPPVRSAVKRERRVRTIHRLEAVEADPPRVVLDITADSGTYVRTLAVDLGEATGAGAHLEELRRISTGPFDEREAVTLTELTDARAALAEGDARPLLGLLHPAERVWAEFPTIVLKDAAASAVAHGAGLAAGGIASVARPFPVGAKVVLLSRERELLATGVALRDASELARRSPGWVVGGMRVFVEPARFPPLWKHKGAPATAGGAPSDG